MKKLILIIVLFFSTNYLLKAQDNCNCNEYSMLKKYNDNDSIISTSLMKSSVLICRAKGYELMGSFLTYANETDSAEYFLQTAEQLYRQTTCGDSVLLAVYEAWAQLYYTKADFAKAQEYSLKMLHSAEAAGNVYAQAKCNTMIAQLFNQTNQAQIGIIYSRKAFSFLDKITDLAKKNSILFLLSKRYLWHYQDTKSSTSLDSSELFSRMQIEIAQKTGNRNAKCKAYNNLQGIEYEKGNFKTALIFLDSSFEYLDKSSIDDIRINYFDKADILIELKKYNEAEKNADSALYYAKLLVNEAFIADSYELCSRIAEKKGNYKKAFELKEMARGISDSIRSVEKTSSVTELEKKYNQAKNENTIKELDKKRQLYLFLAVVGLLTVIIIAFILRQQSLTSKKNILETEQRLNRARMNPHFFFNALTTLQKIALQENDGQAMASNLSKFSNIMRETLESTYKEYVSIEQEMEFLQEYLEVQKIRFPHTFSYEVTATKDLDIDELQIPAMIIQPFVENSIEHGFVGVEYPGKILVHFTKENKELLIQISDNGKGLNTVLKENNEHISRASQIIKDRIYLLNIKLKTKAGFSIDNNSTGTGVIVKIHLPLLYKDQKTT